MKPTFYLRHNPVDFPSFGSVEAAVKAAKAKLTEDPCVSEQLFVVQVVRVVRIAKPRPKFRVEVVR